jgi:prevent-host-death family protein
LNKQEAIMAQRIQSIRPEDIRSLTEFQRNTKECVERLRATGRPEVLTVNGRASIVVQDAEAYQRVLELADRMDELLAVREGLDSIEQGEGVSLEDLDREVRAKHEPPNTPGRTGTEGH